MQPRIVLPDIKVLRLARFPWLHASLATEDIIALISEMLMVRFVHLGITVRKEQPTTNRFLVQLELTASRMVCIPLANALIAPVVTTAWRARSLLLLVRLALTILFMEFPTPAAFLVRLDTLVLAWV